MSKKKLKKEIKRLNKIIDYLVNENKNVLNLDSEQITTTLDYIGGRPNDRK